MNACGDRDTPNAEEEKDQHGRMNAYEDDEDDGDQTRGLTLKTHVGLRLCLPFTFGSGLVGFVSFDSVPAVITGFSL